MNGAPATVTRVIALTREGSVFRLAFAWRPDLVERAKALPYAAFDPDSRTWTAQVCTQSVAALRTMYHEGLCDVGPDALLAPGERPPAAARATLVAGSLRRPYVVRFAGGDDTTYAKLRAVPGARWEREARALSYPATAAAGLAEHVERGLLADPEGLLRPAAVTVRFDPRVGRFGVTGDRRAVAAFESAFPVVDVVATWAERGIDVALADPFSEEVYRGELARAGEGIQPEGLAVELYPFQRVDVAVALERTGLLIASEPGLGKTAVAVATGYELLARSAVCRVVVVVPGSLRTHWAAEIARFTGHEDIVVVEGTKTQRAAAYERAVDARWVVVHYDVVARDLAALAPLAGGALIVADEAHRLKSHAAARSKAMRSLSDRSARRLALSGTPIENVPGEWYSIMSGFTIPGLFGSAQDFLSRYCYPGRFGWEGARNLAELRDRSAVHFVRHRKADVAEHLPPLRVKTVTLDCDPAYAAALRRAHREARREIADARTRALDERGAALEGYERDELEAGAEMTAIGQLRMLCASPRLVAASDADAAAALRAAGLVPETDGPKLDELRRMVAEYAAAGERVVVFSSSRRMVDLVCERLGEDGIEVVRYAGDTPRRERDAAVAAFCAEPTEEAPGPVAFVSTDAGAEGLNLGRWCSTVINLDMPWTASRAWQRANRIHRIDLGGRNYLVVNLVLRGTCEEGILRLVETKADLSDALFGENDGRRMVSGRRGRNVYLEVLDSWEE